MASSDDAREEPTKHVGEINEAIKEMHLAMSEFDHATLRLAQNAEFHGDPLSAPQVKDKLLSWHNFVMLSHTRLRPYVKAKLEDDMWSTTDYDPLVVERDNGQNVGGLQLLDNFHSPYSTESRLVQKRHEGWTRERQTRADLLSPDVYRVATRLLTEARRQLGFGPRADKKTQRSVIDEDLMREVEEWRKQNLSTA